MAGQMTVERAKQIAFCTLQLIRQEEVKKGRDSVDVDDWLFSELDLETSEIIELFDPYQIHPYTGSAYIDGDSPKNFDREYYAK